MDGHPYAPDYISLHVHILHKLARILRDTPPNRGDDDRARMDEAGQLYQEAVRRQATLVKRFPEDAGYRFWLATIRLSTAQFLLERHQPAEARTLLETALRETEKFSQAHPQAKSLTPKLQELYLHLSDALEQLDDQNGSRECASRPKSWGLSLRATLTIEVPLMIADVRLRRRIGDLAGRLRRKATSSRSQRSNLRHASPSHFGKSDAMRPGFERECAARSPASP